MDKLIRVLEMQKAFLWRIEKAGTTVFEYVDEDGASNEEASKAHLREAYEMLDGGKYTLKAWKNPGGTRGATAYTFEVKSGIVNGGNAGHISPSGDQMMLFFMTMFKQQSEENNRLRDKLAEESRNRILDKLSALEARLKDGDSSNDVSSIKSFITETLPEIPGYVDNFKAMMELFKPAE